jgi:hypothetical protein
MKNGDSMGNIFFGTGRNAAILVNLIWAIMAMALFAGGVVMLFNTHLVESSESLLSSRAFQAAETGVSRGKAYISTNIFWYRTLMPTVTGVIGRSSFSTVVITNNAGMARITSTGKMNPTKWTSKWEDIGEDYIGVGGKGRLVQALMVYRDVGDKYVPNWRPYTRFKEVCGEQQALAISRTPSWQRIVANPRTNEFLLVTLDAGRNIYVQACTGNTWFASTMLNVSGRAISDSYRGFDVAYESQSGRGVVVYGDNTLNARYRIWNGTSWSAQATIGGIMPGAAISWVRLVPQPGSDRILCLIRWRSGRPASNNSRAIVWNGMTWGNVTALENAVNDDISYEQMDAAYSANQAIVIYLNGSNLLQPKYRTWNGAAWSGELSLPGALPARPYWIRLEFNPTGIDAFAAFLDSSSRLNGVHWTTAGGWGAYNNFGVVNGVQLAENSYRDFDVAWCKKNNMLMVVYSRAGFTFSSYMIQPQGGSATYGNMLDVGSLGRWSVLRAHPFETEFVYMGLDKTKDISVQRWDGASWDTVAEVETSSSIYYNSIDMAFRNDTNAIPIPYP